MLHLLRPTTTSRLLLFAALAARAAVADDLRLELRDGWAIESSAQVTAGGEAVSRPGFATTGWHHATVPTTVVSALVADGTYPDPYYGTNLRELPGATYKVGTNFSNVAMPADSPFAVPWWYRTEFTLPQEAAGRTLWLSSAASTSASTPGSTARRSPTRRRPPAPFASTSSTSPGPRGRG